MFEPLWARSRYKAAYGGRGSGKSHDRGANLVTRCLEGGVRAVCIREVQKDLKESAKLLVEDKIAELGAPGFDSQRDQIVTPGGGLIIFRGMQDYNAESIKSLEGFDIAWVEEAQTFSERSLELLRPTLRKPGSEIWFTWNPRSATDPVDAFFRGLNPPANSAVVKANYDDNPWFPAELEEEREHDRINNPQRYAHIWLGEYEPAAIGAIWTRQIIHEGRRAEAPDMKRIVVAVDPAVSSEAGSDEHGILVVGLGEDGRGYVLEDGTLSGTPDKWARRAVSLFDKWEADEVVIEINQGGEMCKSTLRTVRPSLPVVEVRATRGKHVRAEPIAALYEQGKVSHVGSFPDLESQMCLMTAAGYDGDGSPDRVDALVWGMTRLFTPMTRKVATKPKGRARVGSWQAA